eukprot:Gb_37495 [translate_table: standard]
MADLSMDITLKSSTMSFSGNLLTDISITNKFLPYCNVKFEGFFGLRENLLNALSLRDQFNPGTEFWTLFQRKFEFPECFQRMEKADKGGKYNVEVSKLMTTEVRFPGGNLDKSSFQQNQRLRAFLLCLFLSFTFGHHYAPPCVPKLLVYKISPESGNGSVIRIRRKNGFVSR